MLDGKYLLTGLLALALGPRATFAAVEARSLTHKGLKRTYLLHVPAKLPRPAPLVLAFHGGSGTGKNTGTLTRFHELAEREGFLVAYPDGIGTNWNDGRIDSDTQAHKEKIDDVGFMDALLEDIQRRHPIDPKRIYATGISNGGIFSHYLAAQRSARIAAIAPVVGGIADPFHKQFKPEQPVAVLIVQSTEDTLVPYAGGAVARRNRGKVISTDETVRLWVDHNGCQREPRMEKLPDKDPRDGCTVQRFTWSGGRAGTEVVLYKVIGGGHTWPGGPQYLGKALIGAVCNDFDATAVIWEFFKKHPKP